MAAEKRYSEGRGKWVVFLDGVLHTFDTEKQADSYLEDMGVDERMVSA